MSTEQQVYTFSSSCHEIEEIGEEEEEDISKSNNNRNDALKSDDFPVNLFSSYESPSSTVNTLNTNNLCRIPVFFAFACLGFIFLCSIILLVYYKPIPPHLHSQISTITVHNFTVNTINTTFSIKFHNPNQKVDLSLDTINIGLHLGYSLSTSAQLSPVYLKAQEHKFFQVSFFEKKFEIDPEIDHAVMSALENQKYLFSLTISFKIKVHLNQFPFAFPYTLVLHCFVISNGPTGPLLFSSCHK